MSEWLFTNAEILRNVTVIRLAERGGQSLSVTMPNESAGQLVRGINSELTKAGKPALPPGEPDSANRFHTPLAVSAEGVTMPGIEGPVRILLTLEDGSQLAIPATQETIDALYRTFRSMTSQP